MQIVLRPDVLREHIARRNLTQNCFALHAGISSSYMAQLLLGTRRPSAPMRAKLLRATGLDFDTLFRIVRHGQPHPATPGQPHPATPGQPHPATPAPPDCLPTGS